MPAAHVSIRAARFGADAGMLGAALFARVGGAEGCGVSGRPAVGAVAFARESAARRVAA